MPNQHLPLLPNHHFHLYNRAVGNELLFRNEENYRYFLRKMKEYILPVAQIWTYSLMPNHFHLLVKIRDDSEIEAYYKLEKRKDYDPAAQLISDFIMEQFSNWLNGYAKAYNKMYARQGALFLDYLKRSMAHDDNDITSFIFYIHKNAVHHRVTRQIGEWKYDGYPSLICNSHTDLARSEVIDWFGSVERLIQFHKQPVDLRDKGDYFD